MGRPSIFYRYALRRLLAPSLALVLALLAALALERLLRLFQLVAHQGASVYEALNLLLYLIPHYLELALPAGLFLGCILGARNLVDHAELVAMRSLGLRVASLLAPLLAWGGALSLCVLALNSYVQPHARYTYRVMLRSITTENLLSNVKPGEFARVGEDLLIWADAAPRRGERFEGFFALRRASSGDRTIVTAKKATRQAEEAAREAGAALLLESGTLVRDRPDDPQAGLLGKLVFEKLLWRFGGEEEGAAGRGRGKDERELLLWELLPGIPPDRTKEAPPEKLAAELHARIARAAAIPLLMALAIPLGLIGSGRTSRARGPVVGVVLIVLYEKVSGFGQNLAGAGAISPAQGIWLPYACLALLTWALFNHFSGDRKRTFLNSPARLVRRLAAPRRGSRNAKETAS